MPTPTYSPTDIGTALVSLIMAVLDVLTGLGVIPAPSAAVRDTMVTSLTVLAVAAATAYVANRRVKHQVAATVAVAKAGAAPTVVNPATAPVTSGGTFTITPVP